MSPFTPKNLDEALRLADIVAASRMYGIASPERAFVLMAAAAALGFEPLQGLAGMRDVDGKPSPSADMLVAACLRHEACSRFVEIESTDKSSTWETERSGNVIRESFSWDDAQRAGLVRPKSPWEKYPRKMLSARAKAALARRVYPDVCFGMYTPDELSGGQDDAPVASLPRASVDVQARAIETAQAAPAQLPVKVDVAIVDDADPFDTIRTAPSKEHAKAAAIALNNVGLDKAMIRDAFMARLQELAK
jgi:hypothetical protein